MFPIYTQKTDSCLYVQQTFVDRAGYKCMKVFGIWYTK